MKVLQLMSLLIIVLFCMVGSNAKSHHNITRTHFPSGFVFGAGSSAYQNEGAAKRGGKGPSIWDTFTMENPGKIDDHSNGDVAEDFYHNYKKDILLMKQIGLDYFRFSLSWSRIFPGGRKSNGVNWEGVKFYNSLIDELLLNGIKPFVTLFHWDVPQALENEYTGLLSRKIVKDYYEYVDFCFEEFGDRVKDWVTVNEPNMMASYGYAYGTNAPGRCSNYIGNCPNGNSATEPYIAVHHLLLCHATAVKLYKQKYQGYQGGKIGISVFTVWIVPKYNTVSSRKAAQRDRDFKFGWVMHPVTYGDYPKSMRYLVGDRLPKFTKEEAKLVKGSFDFIGINNYSAFYADDVTSYSNVNLSYTTDSRVNETVEKNGIPIGQPTAISWLYIYPRGIHDLLIYIHRKYNHPILYVTENGMADDSSLSLNNSLRDGLRIKYHYLHLLNILKAIKEGVDVRGYYIWSFLDDFEWDLGYTVRFGLTFIDYKNGLKRYLKDSAFWFNKFLQTNYNTTAATSLISYQ